MAGCIATGGRDGSLQVIQGLVKPEDMPKETGTAAQVGFPRRRGDGPASVIAWEYQSEQVLNEIEHLVRQ